MYRTCIEKYVPEPVQWLRLHLPIQGSIPGGGAKIPHASWPKNQNIKQKQFCNTVNKHLKKKVHQKKKFPQKSGNKQILHIRLRLSKVFCYWNKRIKHMGC